MLVIKKKQIESFIAEDDTQLHRVISEIIRESFHESVGEYSDETLDSMVRIGIERAGTHGFERAEDIAAFVAVMFEISPEFDTRDEVKAVFGDESIPDESKFEQLFGRVTEEEWVEAEKTYNVDTWFPEQEAAGEQVPG